MTVPSLEPLISYLRKATEFLRERGVESPRLSAELLLAHVLATSRLDLYLRFEEPLTEDRVAAYRELIRRRGKHEPVPYLTGRREFYGRMFRVTRDVLIPRPETEHIVEPALSFMRSRPAGRLLDVGTGSGILAVTLLAECSDWSGVAVDVSGPALAVAGENAEAHGVLDRLQLCMSDLDATLPQENFAVIVSNPPYIRMDEWESLPEQVRGFEPRMALLAGEDGLFVIRPLFELARRRVAPGGLLLCEIGENQGESVMALARQAGLVQVDLAFDLAGKPRVLSALAPEA